MYRFTLPEALNLYRFTPHGVYRFTPENFLRSQGFPQGRGYSAAGGRALGLRAMAGRLVGSTRRPPVASESFRPG